MGVAAAASHSRPLAGRARRGRQTGPGTLQQIVRYLEPFCPKCGENLHMDYHDAAGNCVHQPL